MTKDQLQSAVPQSDPFGIFDEWLAEARETELNDSNAMALATATADAVPSVRMVLLKGHGTDGFTFYTNAHSRKGDEILANAQAALLFHWKSLRRQIRIEGPLSEVSSAVADEYFHSRSRDSQLGAVASDQSRALPDRATFIDRYQAAEAKFAGGAVERPAHWTGFTVKPVAFEFWLDRPNRLHDRRRFIRSGGEWTSTLLYP
ncbi:pyridoxamine 5'-phosphate oxidase [Pontixanthobacter gangjinensis]|uniref:Pyridoxine/pyridoxamine 5'-phosphate oxidase n=1 Tax=Pontixanthobacter gangjinensis TaxID=1028742 RepID=A0A6I4SKB1_9SPHN|nr:pyridoxamine 5'-phosphate oxidase [Pontixanthobacter gangjinensis]MXO55626.1 pyridoxamine 5'-phosphate oxidase [Pontixanthobacter gangjinensis]